MKNNWEVCSSVGSGALVYSNGRAQCPLAAQLWSSNTGLRKRARNVWRTYVSTRPNRRHHCLWYSSVTAKHGRQMASPALVKKFPAFYGARMFNAAFTKACPYPVTAIKATAPHPTSWKSNLLFSSPPCLGLSSSLPLLGFPTTTSYAPPSSPAHLTLLDLITW